MEKQILHVDVNNAFLSWTAVEMLKNGETIDIRTIPAIIGGDEAQRKGVVLAKSNLAKQVGIQTGEPIFFARKKCPNLQIYQGNFTVYRKYSNALYNMLLEYTDKIERFSIDECFMDMTNYIPKGRTLLEIAYEINKRVKEELGFTVNLGVAHNKLLAKMASDFEKPNKVHTLFENEIETKMWKLPISELFMVGKRSLPKLYKMGIKTIKDLAIKNEEEIIKAFGKYGKMIWEYANGIDNSEVIYEEEKPKGIGNSITLPYDYSDIEKIEEVLVALVEQVSYRLRCNKMLAEVVNVQIKTNEFKVYSHQRKMLIPTDNTKIILQEAKKLLHELYNKVPIRLIGVRVDKLTDKEQIQLSLFDNTSKKQTQIDKVVDELKEKYGQDKVTRAGKMNIDKNIKFKD
ncbi:MAG: DNA polymerase IV [Clostridia bacterium]|nr:DNA polymerase IV [Clostridia bacterium]